MHTVMDDASRVVLHVPVMQDMKNKAYRIDISALVSQKFDHSICLTKF